MSKEPLHVPLTHDPGTELYPRMYLYHRIVKSKLFIDEHFAEDIDLSNISDEAYFSKFHYIRLFREIYGKTPHKYLITVRIEKAMQLLRSGIPVSQTCAEVGFESISSFSGLFKKIVGLTPKKYLLQQEHIREQILKAPLHFIPGCFAEKKGWKKNSNFGEVVP